jgi:hypothetical protein
MAKISVALAAIAASVVFSPAAFSQQDQCYQVASYSPPSFTKCQQVGTNQFGKPIWLCC